MNCIIFESTATPKTYRNRMKKKKRSAVYLLGCIHAVLMKVYDKSLTAEAAIEMIRKIIAD